MQLQVIETTLLKRLDQKSRQSQNLDALETILLFPSNLEKIRSEAAWSEERQTWKLPDLIVQKTKLPPAGRKFLAFDSFFWILGFWNSVGVPRLPVCFFMLP